MKKAQTARQKTPPSPPKPTAVPVSPEEIVSQEEARVEKTLKKTALISIFLLLCCVFLYLQISNYSQAGQEKQSKLLTLKNQDQNALTLKQDYNNVKRQAQIITSSLPNKENIVEFVSSLENITFENKYNAQLSFGKNQPQKDAQGFTLIPFKILFTGNLSSLSSYLSQLEKLPYFVKISKITSQNLKGLKSEGQYSLDASLYIFK